MAKHISILFVFIGLIITSCDSSVIYEENIAVDDNIWKFDDIKTFEFEVEDTMTQVNIYINLRTTSDYPYSNIYMFLYSDYPTGESYKDTLEFILAEPDGKWLGENSGTVVEFQSLVSRGGRFTKAGTYSFRLQHAMREDKLEEIVDVGMRIEKMEQ